ncbi:hypothetical protein [Streptomyces sp. NPDC007264]|uniref:hypothetical protein n=1 Tax=Streptomyces sp. NPDC007264 TaxID=3364777 RepID=UPI0036DE7CA8
MSEYDEKHTAPWERNSHERHEPYAWHEPMDRPGPHEDDEQHAGNGTVNHRPEDQSRSEDQSWPEDRSRPEAGPAHAASDPTAADGSTRGHDGLGTGWDRLAGALGTPGPGGFGTGPGGTGPGGTGDRAGAQEPGSDELALRRMLHQAVQDIEPRDGTLEHLRRAVPARRARKRQAAVGMAAAALFIGTAIPALVHVSNATGSGADPSIAGQASQAQGGTGQGKNPDGGSGGSGGSSGGSTEQTSNGQQGTGDKNKGASNGTTGGAGPTPSTEGAPACTADQLGGATATAGAPDSTGAVYGTFHVTNVSTTACTVPDGGSVTTVAQGAADASKISVVDHVTGDAATGLPDPTRYVTSLVLKPGTAYEIKFAWVPSQTCPTGGSGGPSPDPSPSTSASTGGGTTTTGSGTTPQLVREDGVADGSVAVSHTPQTGAAAATATIPDACAGTVYRTGLLPAT